MFYYYLKECWCTEVREKTDERVFLILDNRSAHGDGLPIFLGVECLFLPPGAASLYKPFDQGVLVSLKTNSRK